MEQAQIISQDAMLAVAFQAVRLYAETHPRPMHVTLGQAAEMLGVTLDSLMKMMSGKKLRLNDCGLIPIGDIDQVLASREKRQGEELLKVGAQKVTCAAEEARPARRRSRSDSPDGTLMRLVELEEMVGLKKSAIYKKIKLGEFPAPIKLGFVSLWVRAEVEVWIQQQIAVRDASSASMLLSGEGHPVTAAWIVQSTAQGNPALLKNLLNGNAVRGGAAR